MKRRQTEHEVKQSNKVMKASLGSVLAGAMVFSSFIPTNAHMIEEKAEKYLDDLQQTHIEESIHKEYDSIFITVETDESDMTVTEKVYPPGIAKKGGLPLGIAKKDWIPKGVEARFTGLIIEEEKEEAEENEEAEQEENNDMSEEEQDNHDNEALYLDEDTDDDDVIHLDPVDDDPDDDHEESNDEEAADENDEMTDDEEAVDEDPVDEEQEEATNDEEAADDNDEMTDDEEAVDEGPVDEEPILEEEHHDDVKYHFFDSLILTYNKLLNSFDSLVASFTSWWG
ncbi:MAG: hypothetical protein SCK57_07990 [Bacillota bacterium]|nr:hypothetical protein [Bacillota bacterium]MDW7677586.1 hypothetical protein [Bacillota bacterium]